MATTRAEPEIVDLENQLINIENELTRIDTLKLNTLKIRDDLDERLRKAKYDQRIEPFRQEDEARQKKYDALLRN